MSMKKFTKKMLAIVAAAAMTMGLAMPAFASEAGTEERPKVTKAYISKTYNTEVGKAFDFSFTAEQDTTSEGVIAVEHSITIPTISFAETEKGSTTKCSEEINFNVGTFPQAGKYVYTVKEGTSTPSITNSEHEKLLMSQAEYKMDVYVVEDNGTFKIDNIIVNKTKNDKGDAAEGKVDIGSDPTTNGFRFENTYVKEAGTGTDPTTPEPDDYKKFGSLNVSKEIVMANREAADTTKEFDFTATFTFPKGTDASTLGGVKADGTIIALTGTKNDTYEFKMNHGKSVKFTGLPVGTKISVTEAATPNYKGSAAVTINGVNAGTATADQYNAVLTVSDKTLGQKKNAVDVTNEYNNVPTTGIIMNTLPYVLMVALCGAALVAFVASKRRKVQK